MTVQMIVDRDSGRTFVLFAVSDVEADVVSVVGSFNGWVPGVHTLAPQSDGSRTAFVEVHHPGDIHFRYLASGHRWFDDPTADVVDEHGSTLLRHDHDALGEKPAKKAPAKKKPLAKKAAPAKKSPTRKSVAKKPAKKSSGP